jgi:hypothetical protein
VVLDPQHIAAEVLLIYLRLPVICELLDLYASASMYPAITDVDVFNLPMPRISDVVSEQISQNVRQARLAKASAAHRLEAAKRAVEIAIEKTEAEAIIFLKQQEEDD